MPPLTVMHLVDSLAFGGAERTAINLANHLPRDRYHSVLCTTRASGEQESLVQPHVERLKLQRASLLDHWRAARTLARFIRQRNVAILHAHTSSLFLAQLARRLLGPPRPKLVWHVHFGRAAQTAPPLPYRVAARAVNAAIAVNSELEAWLRTRFTIPPNRITYIPNMAPAPEPPPPGFTLPGTPGNRIVSVANLRPEKDHATLLRAMALVVKRRPGAHLLLVGVPLIPESAELVNRLIRSEQLERHVTLLGPRQDAAQIMCASDIGVVSSVSEGLPVSLLEYGMARLPVVVTPAGQCAEVIGHGAAGLLVPFQAPEALAAALLQLLGDAALRAYLGAAFHARVAAVYGPEAVIAQVDRVYRQVLAD